MKLTTKYFDLPHSIYEEKRPGDYRKQHKYFSPFDICMNGMTNEIHFFAYFGKRKTFEVDIVFEYRNGKFREIRCNRENQTKVEPVIEAEIAIAEFIHKLTKDGYIE